MARINGAILTKLGRAPSMLTTRIALTAHAGSEGQHIADRGEFDVTKQSSELLLLSRHADVMPDAIPPGHTGPRLVRIELPGVEEEENGLVLACVHTPDPRPGQRHREESEVTPAADGKIQSEQTCGADGELQEARVAVS